MGDRLISEDQIYDLPKEVDELVSNYKKSYAKPEPILTEVEDEEE